MLDSASPAKVEVILKPGTDIKLETTVKGDEYLYIQGVFLHWASLKKFKYGKPRLGESTLT